MLAVVGERALDVAAPEGAPFDPLTELLRPVRVMTRYTTMAPAMKAATMGSKGEWISQPAGVSHIRRCKASGGLATEYCELAGEVEDDYVSFGHGPDLCPLHTSSVVPVNATTPVGTPH